MQTEYGLSFAFIHIMYAQSVNLNIVWGKREIRQFGEPFIWRTDNWHAYIPPVWLLCCEDDIYLRFGLSTYYTPNELGILGA